MSGLIETREDFDRLIAKAERMAKLADEGKLNLKIGGGVSNRRAGTFEVYHFNQQEKWIDGKTEVELWYGNESEWRKQMQNAILRVILKGREPKIVLPQCWTGEPAKHTAEQLEYDRATSPSNMWTPDSNDWKFKYKATKMEQNEIPKALELPLDQTPQPGSKYPMVVEVESKSEPGKIYKVTIENEQGFATCACKGFQYRHDCRHCKLARQQVFGKETSLEVAPDKVDNVPLDAELEDLLGE